MTEVVVVGSGPNGLAAAVTMARAGLAVRVVELADSPGGGTRSAELFRPGVLHDICSAVHPMALASPFFRAFGLADRIELRTPEISYAQLLTPSVSGIAYRDLDRTAHDLGVDGRAWHRFFRPLLDRIDGVVDIASGPLLHLPASPLAAAVLGLRALESGSSLLWNLRFREAIAPAMLAGVAAHAIGPMPRPAQSGAGLLLAALAHHGGWPVPVGGSQAIADAMIDDIRAHGGTIETGCEITDLAEVADARAVLLDVSPRALADIGRRQLPDRYLRALRRYRYGDAAAKVDLLLSGPVPWSDPQVARAATLHLGGTRSETATAEREVAAGRFPTRPYVLLAQQAVVDPSRTRDGLHPIWAYTHVPNGSTADVTDLVLDRIEEFAPGVRDLVVDSRCTTAAGLGRYNPNNVGGDIATGAVDLRQLLARPVISPAPWRTPAAGVYLCSSATPPGPGVTGMSGLQAARTALRDVFDLDVPDLGPLVRR